MKKVFWVMMFGIMAISTPQLMAYLGTYFVDDGNIITARNLSDSSVNWTHIADADIDDMVVIDDTLTHKSLLLFYSGGMTHTLDAVTGQELWSKTGYVQYVSRDAQNRLYTQSARFPNGIPTHGGSLNPVVTVSNYSDAYSDVSLVDALTGQTHWTHSVNFKRYGFGYLPLTSGGYDILCGGGPHFTSGGGPYYARLDGATGQTEVWTRQFANRLGIAIPDITGDGIYDVFASPSYWSTDLQVINGTTGATIYSTNYGGFDIVGHPILLSSSSGPGCDVITTGQGGPMRRYHVDNSALSVVWQNAESNNCLEGTIERADGGLTILSHRRHQQQVAGVDAATGLVLWSIPAWAGDNGATIGVPDLTGDGSQDVLSVSGGYCRLYDGMTGVEQTWFTPVAANNGFVAYSAMPPIAVVSPNGGEHVVAGTEYSILWSAADSITDVHLEYSTNNGQVWKNIATVPNTGSYVWQVPVKHSDQCLIRISVLGHPDDMVDTSNTVFTIFVCYPVAGDLNGDCYVDLADFAILAGNWLACGNLYDPACFSEQQRSMMLMQMQETE